MPDVLRKHPEAQGLPREDRMILMLPPYFIGFPGDTKYTMRMRKTLWENLLRFELISTEGKI